MIHDKAMIIIAVSQYDGTYPDLPGTVTSAQRLRRWAEQQDADCNYNVLYLGDDQRGAITIDLVREEVSAFIDSNFIDRLVVYFAGHGIVRSAGAQFWLLTRAANDLREGIDVEGFRRGLLKCGIGKHNDQVRGQICLFGDACRNTDRDAIEFTGDPILTRNGLRDNTIQLDRFLSTGLGDFSFHMDGAGDQIAYCLFSEVLLDGLSGTAIEAVDTEHHRFSPVVTNHKLADYVDGEVQAMAAAIGKTMKPDLYTGIRPPYNFYKRLEEMEETRDLDADPEHRIGMSVHMRSNLSQKIQRADSYDHREAVLREAERALDEYPPRFYGDGPSFYTNFPPSRLAVPRPKTIAVRSFGEFFVLEVERYHPYAYGPPILVAQVDQWIIMPAYPNVAVFMFRELPGDLLLCKHSIDRYELRRPNLYGMGRWDTYLSDFLNHADHAPLRAADARKFADAVRRGKEEYPHQAVTAGYLYEFANDYDNIARTAHYMARSSVVPFDLALLCADAIRWEREDGQIVAYADIPASEPIPYDVAPNRPRYARTSFEARRNVNLWGIAPIFRQGWSFMQTERNLEIPEEILRIAEETSGRSATSLTGAGLEMFLEAFDYHIVETN